MTTPYPPWAKWIAQDEDGKIIVCDKIMHPIEGKTSFWNHGVWWTGDRDATLIIFMDGKPNPHWRNSLDCLGDDDETI